MNAITAARRDLAALLEGTGVTAVDHVPEELPSPCVVLDYTEDPLDRADTFDHTWWITLRVYALVDIVANQQATEDLEDLLDAVLPALAGSEWEVDGLTRPGPFRTTQWLAHGTAITVRTTITLTPGEHP